MIIVDEMTDEEININIKIAEVLGWKWVEGHKVRSLSQSGAINSADGWLNPNDPDDVTCSDELPNYAGDLNEMHEAEGTLTLSKLVLFASHLESILVRDRHDTSSESEVIASCIHATAIQRAEAFLKTLDLWEE